MGCMNEFFYIFTLLCEIVTISQVCIANRMSFNYSRTRTRRVVTNFRFCNFAYLGRVTDTFLDMFRQITINNKYTE